MTNDLVFLNITVASVFLTNELRVISYELRVAIYCMSYELLFIARVTSYFLHTSYELLLIAQELRVNFYVRVTSYELNL